jgi:hypothetical protein
MKLSTGSYRDPEKASSSTTDEAALSDTHFDVETAVKCEAEGPSESLVDWDDAQDAENPQNFESREKWTIIILVSAITFNQ